MFHEKGRTEADLEESGRMLPGGAWLIIGSKRESRQDLIKKVGMISRVQEAL